MHAQNGKENCADFYNLVLPGEAKMCLDFMSFRAPPAAPLTLVPKREAQVHVICLCPEKALSMDGNFFGAFSLIFG